METFQEIFERSGSPSVRVGSLIKGQVIEIRDGLVVVNVGLKSEGAIPADQFRAHGGELEVVEGDEVEVAVDAIENGSGETILSRGRAKRARLWKSLEDSYTNDKTVEGRIVSRVKGGFIVDLGVIQAFLPGSLVDTRPTRGGQDNDKNFFDLENKVLEFKIIKFDERRNNVVVSRRAVLELRNAGEREALLKVLEKGQVLKGIVKNLTSYGAFIDLGGVDGLLHVSDMAWKRVRRPAEAVTEGEEIKVKVLDFDEGKTRISLGLKQLVADPWEGTSSRYPKDTRLFGVVTSVTDYGCFVEMHEGVEGLVHVSEMSWLNRNTNPRKLVTAGQQVEVVVLEIDEESRRISLGMKQCLENPWQVFGRENRSGAVLVGGIERITDFGLFVRVSGDEESGIDGLVHLSDLSWTEAGAEAIKKYSKGDQISVVLLAVDVQSGRISLGVKQLELDPLAGYQTGKGKKRIASGTVVEVNSTHVKMDMGEGVNGLISVSEFSGSGGLKMPEVGETLEVKLLGLDKKKRVLNLSVSEKFRDEEKEILRNYAPEKVSESPSLGEIVESALERSQESRKKDS